MGELIYFPLNTHKGKALGKHRFSSSGKLAQPIAISVAVPDECKRNILQPPTSPNIVVNIKLSLEMTDEKQ